MTKNRFMRTFVIVAILLCTVIILFACSDAGGGTGGDKPSLDGIVIDFMDGDEKIHSTTDPQEALSFEPEAKEGLVFEGWFLDEDLTEQIKKLPTKSLTLYAKWTVKTFKVTFKHNDGSIIKVDGEDYQTVAYGESAVAPEDPTLEGFTFKGWDEDFSSVKSDLTVRAMFDTKTQDIVVYDDNGEIIKRVSAPIGSDITVLYNTLYDEVEQEIPGGLSLDALCVDAELTETYDAPTSNHTMPYTDLVLYTRVVMQDIEGLNITASRDNFRYDTKGFNLTSSLYSNSVITYSYAWYDVTAGAVIEDEDESILAVGCKDVGEYSYKVIVTANYKNLEPKTAEAIVNVKVNPGTLENLVSVSGFSDVYNGKTRELVLNGTLPGDVVTYRRVGETDYVASFIKDAGDYNIETKIERANYEPLELTGTKAVQVSIAKKELALTISLPIDRIFGGVYQIYYGSAKPVIEYVITGFVDGENETFLEGGKVENNPYSAGEPVGRYELSLDKNSWTSNNYEFDDDKWPTIQLQVLKRDLTINVEPKEVVYGDVAPIYTVSLEGALEADVDKIKDTVQYTCEYDVGTPVNSVGYVISANYANDDYVITINNSNLMVLPKAVTVTPNDVSVTYGDAKPRFTFKTDGLIDGEDVSVLGTPIASCQYTANSETKTYSGTGTYKISINQTSFNNANYTVTCGTGILTVNKKSITLSMADTSIVYYEAYPEYELFATKLSAEGLVGNDTVENSLKTDAQSFTSNYAIGQPVGTYKVTVGGYSSPNYIINNNQAVVGNLVVGKRPLTISAQNATVTYGDALQIKVTYSGLVGDDLFDPEGAISGGEVIGGYEAGYNVGTYTVSIGNYVASNYAISYETANITVVKKALTIKARGYTEDAVIWNGAFDSDKKANLLEVVGLIDGDTIQGVLQSASDAKGVYVVNGTVLDGKFVWDSENPFAIVSDGSDKSGNYAISYDFQVAINTVGVFVTANSVIYDGGAYGLDVEYLEGFEGLDLVTVEYSADGASYSTEMVTRTVVGTYDIYYKITLGDEVKESEKLSLTISPRPITVKVDDKAITYGDAEPTLTYSVVAYEEGKDAFATGEDINSLGSLLISAEEYQGNAGYYNIVASGLNNANYDINVVNATLTVNRKDLYVTAGSYTITYGDALPAYSANVEGFVEGESIDSLGTKVLFNCAFTADVNGKAGEYQIVPVLSLSNYKTVATNGTLTVNKKAVTLKADAKTVTFGDATPTLTATPSGIASWDNVSTMGTVTLTTSYVRGNSKGEYAINITATSDKYEISAEGGTIKVNAKSVAVSWTGSTAKYTYDGTDRSSLITATYVDIDGVVQNASVAFLSKNEQSTTPNKFQNAATYTVTASTADGNYSLSGKSFDLVMNKAEYSADDVSYANQFNGVYSPEKTLGNDYVIGETGFNWKNGNVVPTVDVEQYDAYYNLDRENYLDFELKIYVIIAPALVSLDSNSSSVNADIDVVTQIDINSTNIEPTYTLNITIWWIDGAKAIGSGYTLSYSNGTVFKPGSHLTTMTFTSTNYALNTSDGSQTVNYFIKYKSVLVGDTLYTPEDALNTATSGTAIVKANTTFASQQEVISRYYSSNAYYTVKSGVTFLLPLSATDTTGFLNVGESGSDEYNAHPANASGVEEYINLDIPSNVTLNVSGTLTVGAVTGRTSTGKPQNDVTGKYTVINLSGNIYVNGATLNVYGYIVGGGKVTATGSTTVTENMHLIGWEGGTISAARFIGNDSINLYTIMSGGDLSVDNPTMFPFNQYELRSIQSKLELQYGSSLRGVVKIATSETAGIIKAKISLAYFPIVSSSTDASSGIIRMSQSSDKVTKTTESGRVKLTLDGQISDGYTTLSVGVVAKTVSMSSQKVFFPINGTIDIVVNSGTFTQNYMYKMLPGATLTVKAGATYNMNGTIVAYKEGFTDIGNKYPSGRGNAKVIVEGTMNVNGSFGGDVYGASSAKVVIGANATITGVKSVEGTGALDIGLSASFTFTESQSQTRDLTLNNASGTTTATKGVTYTHNGTAWA